MQRSVISDQGERSEVERDFERSVIRVERSVIKKNLTLSRLLTTDH
jgi:hypothetical protein